ncbi:hypothetical protein TrRE_jg9224 [Triparma retinervis]|uniref:Uncharacterized protein n=1 Tax=Triparma retinervis TaxID=2557542 RepID=A0A9W7L518_9STRA|nr:hypothetical protein TrRE_jg9224 [Triparma retinervis]
MSTRAAGRAGPALLNARDVVDGRPVAVTWQKTLEQTQSAQERATLMAFSKRNEKLYKATTDAFGIDPRYGCKNVAFDKGAVERLVKSMTEGFELARQRGKKKGEFAVRSWYDPEHLLYYDGYSTYGKVEAKLDPMEQRKATTMLKVGDLKHFCKSIDGFKELYGKAKEVAGDLVLLDMHFLQQSSAQAIFSWHHDCEQYSHMVLSIVLSLTDTASSMQVAGYDEIMYQGSGSASCFLSNATHRSGFAERGTKKIAFFFGLESRMDTYETYPKVIRAPLPTLPIFYDKKSDCQKVGCFCLHNHVIIEKDDFLTGEGCYMVADEISQEGNLRPGKIKAQHANGKVLFEYSNDRGVGTGAEATLELDQLLFDHENYKDHYRRCGKNRVFIGKVLECQGCGRQCHKACLGLDEDEIPPSVTCPICLKKTVILDPNTGNVSVDGVDLSALRSITMMTYKKCAPYLQLDGLELISGMPMLSTQPVTKGSREPRMAYPKKAYEGAPLQVILNLQTTSLRTQTGMRDGVTFFETIHEQTEKMLSFVQRRDPWDYALPPECLVYQGNGYIHVYLKGVVWSSTSAAKDFVSYDGDDAFQYTVPGAIFSDPNGNEVKQLLERFMLQKPCGRLQELDVLLGRLVNLNVAARVSPYVKVEVETPSSSPSPPPSSKEKKKKKKKKKRGDDENEEWDDENEEWDDENEEWDDENEELSERGGRGKRKMKKKKKKRGDDENEDLSGHYYIQSPSGKQFRSMVRAELHFREEQERAAREEQERAAREEQERAAREEQERAARKDAFCMQSKLDDARCIRIPGSSIKFDDTWICFRTQGGKYYIQSPSGKQFKSKARAELHFREEQERAAGGGQTKRS